MSVKAEELEIVIKGNIKDAVQKLDYLKNKINNVLDKQAKALQPSMQAMNKTMTQGATQAVSKMDVANKAIDLQTQKVRKLQQQWQKYNEYQKAQAKLNAHNEALSVRRGMSKKMQAQTPVGSIPGELSAADYNKYSWIVSQGAVKDVENELGQAELKLLKLQSQANQTAASMQKKLAPAVKEVGKKIKEASKNAISATKIFKRMSLPMIIGRVIRTAINEAIKGFQDLARYSSDFNASMSTIQGQFVTVRNSLAVAFEPLIKAIVPAIEWLTDRIINLFNALSKINTLLFTNNKTYTIAKKVTTNYAQSLGDVAKEQNKVLAGFDELNVLGNQTNDTGTGLPDASEMFETVELDRDTPEKYNKFTQSLIELRKAIEPFTETLFSGLRWLWENILKPLGNWVVNGVAPLFIELIAKAINACNTVLEKAKPYLVWLWENFLQPLANWTGDLVIEGLTMVTNILGGLFDVLSGDKSWSEFLDSLSTAEKWVGLLGTALVLLSLNPTTQIILAIGGIVAAVIELVNWLREALELLEETTNDYSDRTSAGVGRGGRDGSGGGGGGGGHLRGRTGGRLASGGVLTRETLFIGGEYAGAGSNPEIVAPQSMMYETNMKANVPVMNAIEELGDKITEGLSNISVYADFGYDKLRVGLNKENKRIGQKAYGGGY